MSAADEHERILQGVLVGDLDRADQEVRRHLDECADCRERLERLSGFAEHLDELGHEERTMLKELAESEPEIDPGFEQVIRRVRRGDRRRAPWWALAAAAVLVVFFAAYRWLPGDGPGGDIPMGDDGVELVTPEGTVQASYGVFRWTFELPSRGYFLFEIVDDTPEGRGTIVLPAKRLEENRWDPATEPALRLPGRIRWSVQAYGAGGTALGSGEARAERSSD